MMSISITTAEVALAPSIANAMVSARWKDPHWVALFRPDISSARVTSETAQRLPWNLITGRATKRHQIAVDDLTGEVVAYARWILPEHLASVDPVVWPQAQVQEPTEDQMVEFEKMSKDITDRGLRMDLLEYRSAQLEEIDAKIRESGPFLDLDYLATAPEYQRRGIGAMLLRAGLGVADAYGLKSFVTSSVAGIRLYQKHGFEVVETHTMDYSQFGGVEPVINYFMIRKPRGKHDS
ncbi:acyl-CoA N-acyltransferase, partial [Aureobasidium melanogenum]